MSTLFLKIKIKKNKVNYCQFFGGDLVITPKA